ncbi:hypothetical protein K431DRAFT_280568 [Polychaeton citri CBS 116435]|uniref:Uncharacterized protein n=1 Tax=Polychaeton citri CBS 116435 TaxID=1314669 RepID=A0A9P4QG68_9PEZI|nr:hypothetical protein K431DRAFT_280568 [Polychaeton citri CBS 116435]
MSTHSLPAPLHTTASRWHIASPSRFHCPAFVLSLLCLSCLAIPFSPFKLPPHPVSPSVSRILLGLSGSEPWNYLGSKSAIPVLDR